MSGGCVICGYDEAEHQGVGEMLHDFRPVPAAARPTADAVATFRDQELVPAVRETLLRERLEALAAELEADAERICGSSPITCEAWSAAADRIRAALRGDQ